MPQKQLNIRSDEAARRASLLARQLGKTTTEVVEEALRVYETSIAPRDELGLTPEARKRYDAIMEAARRTHASIIPGTVFDDSWMYDDNGLPK